MSLILYFRSRLLLASALIFISLAMLSSVALATRFILPGKNEIIRQLNNSEQQELDPSTINILVWNMYKGYGDGWQDTYRHLSMGKQILMLQEVFLDQKMLNAFHNDTSHAYLMATSFIDTWKEDAPSGVATASISKSLDHSYLRSQSREPVAGTPKMGIFIEYGLSGTDKNLLTANIHAINFVGAETMESMLDRVEDRLRAHDGPVILAGDFNTWSDARLAYLHDMVKRLDLIEVHFPEDRRTRVLSHPLDWVFVKDLRIVSAKVHDDIESSDHNALEVMLSFDKI